MSSYKSYTDSELLSLVAANNHGAYTEIYNRYAALLYVHARRKLADREDARDIIQELFTAFWNNRASLDEEIELSKYLYAAVRYKIINHFARKKLKTAYLDTLRNTAEIERAAPDHRVRETELKQLIEREVNLLPRKMREIFCMSRQQNLSHREIAEQLHISEATVKKQVNNALKVLRVKLGPLLSLCSLLLF
ncbi:RNA polymerase sigma-70 factor, ECF subfamily [Parapedobacter composti]|uniref:RNA polymerase sigma-70 factor, ECF subfamily n=1 Tax=Parapedobacter composti TaxID=623281 RepID=A0A1I1FTE9_9SPHI|nr:RNA polymerase sigma-70 factor [Parapedobacter composti]SFC00343.1 RNA polymerase sigma-70 factor, ECF subfamily [Parapedobacter composti]